MDAENLAEFSAVLRSETGDRRLVLDLRNLALVDRDAVGFLARCETENMEIRNCPPYIREWMARECQELKGQEG